MKLSSILFEGMVKIPPEISAHLMMVVENMFASKVIGELEKEKRNAFQQSVEQIEATKAQFARHITKATIAVAKKEDRIVEVPNLVAYSGTTTLQPVVITRIEVKQSPKTAKITVYDQNSKIWAEEQVATQQSRAWYIEDTKKFLNGLIIRGLDTAIHQASLNDAKKINLTISKIRSSYSNESTIFTREADKDVYEMNVTKQMLNDWEPGNTGLTAKELINLSDWVLRLELHYTDLLTTTVDSGIGFYHPAWWIPNKKGTLKSTIRVAATPNLKNFTFNKFQRVLEKIVATLLHELTHFSQELLQRIKTRTMWSTAQNIPIGMPGKSIRKKPYNRLEQHKSPHEGRDVEFYARLSTELSWFLDSMTNDKNDANPDDVMERNHHKALNFFKEKVGLIPGKPRYWFGWLKNHDEKRWRKAVSVLYTELGAWFVDPKSIKW